MWCRSGRRKPMFLCAVFRLPSPIFNVRASTSQALDSKTTRLISWLRNRGAADEHSALAVGMSSYGGRGMFASRPIQAGDRMLEIPCDLMITPERLPEDVIKILPGEATEWARLALFILAERKKGQASAWHPFIEILPCPGEIHNTVFWGDEELECVKHSPLYLRTMQRKELLRREFAAVQNALSQFSHIFGETVSSDAFNHAYSIVGSRSWRIEESCALAMVPCIDLINHDWSCRSLLSCDPDKNCVLVIADRDYAVGQEVAISYGHLPNVILAVDYGFALPYNPADEAEIWVTISPEDPLYRSKLQLLSSNNIQLVEDTDGSVGRPFVIQDVHAKSGAIPHGLRSFARVLSASSSEELARLVPDATGELVWSSTDNKSSDSRAMLQLSYQFDDLIQQYVRAELVGEIYGIEDETRRNMAQAVLDGELRTLKSATSWLKQSLALI